MDDFERMLYQGAAQLPPDVPAEEPPKPWREPMNRVCWGLVLVTFTLKVFCLDTVLPAVGTVLLWLGLRSLRRENGGFRFAFRFATAYTALRFANIIALATPLDRWLAGLIDMEWHSATGTMPFYYVIRAGVVQLVLVLAVGGLWQGLKQVFRGAGQTPRTGAAGALVVLEALLFPLSAIGVTGWLLVGPLLLVWALIIGSVFRLSRSLDQAGYALTPAPARVSDGRAAACWLVPVLTAVVVLPFCFARLPVEAETPVYGPSDGQSALRTQLLELGFPEELLSQLSDGDVSRFEGTYGVTVTGWPVSSGEHPDGMPHVTLAEVPVRDEHYGWRVVYLAQLTWDEGVNYRMEGFRLVPDYHNVVAFLDGPEGRLEWEGDGAFHTAAMDIRKDGWMEYLCDFSLPEADGPVTGYVCWSVVPTYPEKTSVYNYGFDFAHRTAAWQWPYTLPTDVVTEGRSQVGWRQFQQRFTGHLAPEGMYESGGYSG